MFTIFSNFEKSGILSGVFSLVRPHRKDEWPWPWWFKSFKTAIFMIRCHKSFSLHIYHHHNNKPFNLIYNYAHILLNINWLKDAIKWMMNAKQRAFFKHQFWKLQIHIFLWKVWEQSSLNYLWSKGSLLSCYWQFFCCTNYRCC